MKRKVYYLLFALAIPALIALSCKKNEQDKEYKDTNRITLSGDAAEFATADSTEFSFGVQPPSMLQYNLTLVASVMGNVSATDRTFTLQVDNDKTTALAEEYALPASFVVKAGSVVARIPVTIKRSARIASRSVKLTLKLVENTDFKVGIRRSFSYVWTDDLVKPSNWDITGGVGFYFGKYSKVKHRLVVNASEYKNLAVLSGQTSVLLYIASRSLDDLNAYNIANPGNPLKSEAGVIIGICSTCD